MRSPGEDADGGAAHPHRIVDGREAPHVRDVVAPVAAVGHRPARVDQGLGRKASPEPAAARRCRDGDAHRQVAHVEQHARCDRRARSAAGRENREGSELRRAGEDDRGHHDRSDRSHHGLGEHSERGPEEQRGEGDRRAGSHPRSQSAACRAPSARSYARRARDRGHTKRKRAPGGRAFRKRAGGRSDRSRGRPCGVRRSSRRSRSRRSTFLDQPGPELPSSGIEVSKRRPAMTTNT